MKPTKVIEEKEREVFLCDICDNKSRKDTILFHHTMYMCLKCKHRIERLPMSTAENLARWFNGNVM